jgi:hypothetical protein
VFLTHQEIAEIPRSPTRTDSRVQRAHRAPNGDIRAVKIAIAVKVGSRALRADAMEAVTCGWLSWVVVISLAAQRMTGARWIDNVGSLAIAWFLIKEGREAWARGECCYCRVLYS